MASRKLTGTFHRAKPAPRPVAKDPPVPAVDKKPIATPKIVSDEDNIRLDTEAAAIEQESEDDPEIAALPREVRQLVSLRQPRVVNHHLSLFRFVRNFCRTLGFSIADELLPYHPGPYSVFFF